MKTLYSIYVISIVALLTAMFAVMGHILRQRRVRAVVSRARVRLPYNVRSTSR
jgi:hypothetical protein